MPEATESPFLTPEKAQIAVRVAMVTLDELAVLGHTREQVVKGHFIVLDASGPFDPEHPAPVLYQESFSQDQWGNRDYAAIAMDKAQLSHRYQRNSWDVINTVPQLMHSGDVLYGGAVWVPEARAVIAFSGDYWWVDEIGAKIASVVFVALAAAEARAMIKRLQEVKSAHLY